MDVITFEVGDTTIQLVNGEALFFAILAAVLVVAVLAVFIIDRHAPPTRKQAVDETLLAEVCLFVMAALSLFDCRYGW